MTWIKTHKGICILIVIVLIIGIVAALVLPKMFSRGRRGDFEGMTKQNTISLTKMDLTDSVSATGTIESVNTTTVSADVQNIEVKDVLVEVGDTVTEGQKLVAFDKSDLKQAIDDAQSDYDDTKEQLNEELSQAYEQLSEAKSTYASDKKKYEKIVAQAEKALKKAKKAAKSSSSSTSTKSVKSSSAVTTLSDTETDDTAMSAVQAGTDGVPSAGAGGTGSDASSASGNTGGDSAGAAGVTNVTITDDMTVDEAKSALEQAKENLETVNAQNKKSIKTAEQAVETAKSNKTKQLKEAKKAVQDAKDTYNNAAITASMDGTVTGIGVSAGDTYNGGDAVEISDLTSFQVTTTVTEYDITSIEKGQRVVILTDATGDEELEGEITYVALTSSSSSTLSSGTSSSGGDSMGMGGSSSSSSSDGYEIVITLKSAPDNIRVGMTAKCSIIINEADDVYAVPYDAIHEDESGNNVIYVLDSSGNQKNITVEKGMESDYYVEVKSDELSEGLSVIIPTDSTTSSDSSSDSSDSGALDGLMGGGGQGGGPGGGGDFSGGPGGNGGGPGGGPGGQ